MKVYQYVGNGAFLMGVPARDLTPSDLVEIEGREGVTEQDIRQSGLYAPREWVEVASFCGAELAPGVRCKAPVARWGDRCEAHGRDKEA